MTTFTPDFDKLDEDRDELLGENEEETTEPKETASPFDGDDVPEELRGKTPAEVIAHYNQVKTAGKSMADLYMASQRQPPKPEPEPEPVPKITADDFLDESGSVNQKIERIAEMKIRPYLNEARKAAADNMYSRAMQSTPYLQDYRDEVNQIITSQGLTTEQIANPATWALIDAHIMKTHATEIYEKYAQKKRKPEPPSSIRGDIRGRTSQDATSKLTAEQREFAKLLGANLSEAEKFAGIGDE